MNILRFLFLFSALSFVFSFAAFGWLPHRAAAPWPAGAPLFELPLPPHEAAHFLVGALVALPCRRGDAVLACGAAAVLFDVDHIGWLFGLPMIARPSHSIPFVVVASAAMWYASRRGWLGATSPRLAVATTVAAVLAHVAVEVWTPFRKIPALSPLRVTPVVLAPAHSVALMAVAAVVMWLGAGRKGREGQAVSDGTVDRRAA